MQQSDRAGSLVSSILIGVALVAALIGVAYLTRTYLLAPEPQIAAPATPETKLGKDKPAAEEKHEKVTDTRETSSSQRVTTPEDLPQTGPSSSWLPLVIIGSATYLVSATLGRSSRKL